MQTYHFEASQLEHTPAGKLLGKMYYGGFIDAALKRGESTGYPHNGGQHSLTLILSADELTAFLSLVEESYPQHPGTSEFIASVRERAIKNHPRLFS
jgi:hypothetical protein